MAPDPLYQANDILFSKYRILRFLGRGAFAEVYQVEHLSLKVDRAIKVLRRDASGLGSSEMASYRDRFQLEAQLGARLNSPTPHPNLLQVHDLPPEQEGVLLLEMEYASGGSLAGRIQESQSTGVPLALDFVIQAGIDIAQGLAILHQRNIIHRDVKPSNILLTGEGCAKLADLGLAQIPESRIVRLNQGSLAQTHPGTYEYMPPEQRPPNAAPLRPNADVYALGSTLFEALTGRLYYLLRPETRLKELRPDAPDWLDALLARMLSNNPEDRPWDGAEVALLLTNRQARSRPPISAPALSSSTAPPVAPPSTKPRSKLPPTFLALVGVLLLAGLLGFWWAIQSLVKLYQPPASAATATGLATDLQSNQLVSEISSPSQTPAPPSPTFSPSPQPSQTPAILPSDTPAPSAIPARSATPTQVALKAQFIKDVTLPDQTVLDPGAPFTKTWRIKNIGSETWTPDFRVVFSTGDLLGAPAQFNLKYTVAPGETIDISVNMVAPGAPGAYASHWLLQSPDGKLFGTGSSGEKTIWVKIKVASPTRTPLPPAPSCSAAGETYRSPADQMLLLCVPSAEFFMGSATGDADEAPIHTVFLDTFWIDQVEVTNAQFARFLNENGNQQEGGATWLEATDNDVQIQLTNNQWQAKPGFANRPVIGVSWYGARSYCQWAGRQLPSEAQWEKAARGGDGRTFPWGEAIDCSRAQYRECGAFSLAVGSLPAGASPYGALDLAGNTWEWVADWYSDTYYAQAPYSNPAGPARGDLRVVRGGSWDDIAAFQRTSKRSKLVPTNQFDDVGFRCSVIP